MDRTVLWPALTSGFPFVELKGQEVLSSQLQAINPILILIYIPIFSYVIYPLLGRCFRLTSLRKVAIGLFLTAAAFGISGYAQLLIDRGQTPHVQWQVWAYVVLTAAEVMVSITCLEFSYTQAPNRMKSLIMALYLLSVSGGNALTSLVNYVIQDPSGESRLPGAVLLVLHRVDAGCGGGVHSPCADLPRAGLHSGRGRTRVEG